MLSWKDESFVQELHRPSNVLPERLLFAPVLDGLYIVPSFQETCTLHDITDLAQELTVWLQVWYKMDDTPRVLRPSLNLSQVRWEDVSFDDSAVMELHFKQHLKPDDVPDENEHFGILELDIHIWRKLFSVRGMDGPPDVHMYFAGFVDDEGSYLTSGYLSKLKSVCS